MRQFRIYHKRIILCIIFCVQAILIAAYLLLRIDITLANPSVSDRVSFVTENNVDDPPLQKQTYHTDKDNIRFKLQTTESDFIDFNTSICYKNGTDIKSMVSDKALNWNCKCLPSFHGNNCGQPEVIWRALLTYRKPINLKGPRKYKRHILHVLHVDKFLNTAVEIAMNELNDIIDLFVLFEYEGNKYLKTQLNGGFMKKFHNKVLYLSVANEKELVMKIQNSIKNLNQETLVIFSSKDEVINKSALTFLKLYDDWPEPLVFRLRWSVYGYFWLHPQKTILKTNIFTLTYLSENWNGNIPRLFKKKYIRKYANKEFIIGDLNHYGGWFCEYCYDSSEIIDYLITKNITLLQREEIKIDREYVEELIENGLYIDGKTELERVHRSSERYYAPQYVIENSWNYDWLLINLYLKLDY